MTTNERRWQRLAEMIVERRTDLGWTQTKLSVVSKVSQQVLRDLENARRADYEVSTLVKVQKALGWDIGSIQDILAGGQPTERPTPSTRPA